jgi:dihydroorotate dehydrogenase
MWLDQEDTIRKREIFLEKPFLNATGTLGFYPNPHTMPFLQHMGAFLTNPISRHPRQPAGNRACLPFPGGFLLHTGLQNPGINRAIGQFKRRWAGAPLPVIVHLLVESPQGLTDMIRRLEGFENIMGVELGLPPGCQPEALAAILKAARGELPLILSLNPEQIPILLPTLQENSQITVHLMEPRGMLPNKEGELVTGRLYGSAIYPQMFKAAKALADEGLQVIVNGGVSQSWQAKALLACGVMAVGLGSLLWRADSGTFFTDF